MSGLLSPAADSEGLGSGRRSFYPQVVDLLERDTELVILREAIAGAATGTGSGVAVAGESGAGKSALLTTACAGAGSMRVVRGVCDPLRTPRPLGPFRDIAREVGLGPLLHDRDELLSQICEDLYAALAAEPTVVVVEDLHWIDAASVEVLRFLARRLDVMPLALLVSHRGDEIGPRHPARPLLGDFARLDQLRSLELRPLSIEAVRILLAGTELEPNRVREVTGGNPFFVTEVARDAGGGIPASVRDAVLSRTVDLEPTDLEVLQLVATAPDRLEDRLLPALGVDLPTLRRLDAVGLLERERGGLRFRHELARQALESTVPPGGAPHLHARLLKALETVEPQEASVLTHHAVAAHDNLAAVRYAQEAAREAVIAGSHAEAAAFLETAVEYLEGAVPSVRARLLLQLSFELYMTSRLAEAIDTARSTFVLWRQAGDVAGLAHAYQTCAMYEYYNAHRRQADRYVERAVDIAYDSGARAEYGMASATRGFQAYMRNELELATSYAAEAGQIARDTDQPAVALKTDVVHALVALSGGDTAARAVLADYIESARDHGWDELASTAYSQLSSLDVEHRRYRAAELVLEESLPFTVERDIPICRHWQTSVRSRLHFAEGHWNAALEDAAHVLHEDGMPLATLWPELVTGLVLLRAGDTEQYPAHLESAWALAIEIDEPLRRLPVLSALAEAAWLTGRTDRRVTEAAAAELQRTASAPGTEWGRGELAVWLRRLGLSDRREVRVAEPYDLLLTGDAEGAANWFRLAGDRFSEAMAWGDSADQAHQTKGVQLLDQLGAVATADRRRVALRRAGVASVPPRPRASTRANPAGLTNRQLEVARFVARGFTNAEISSRLYISAKTADHHVSAVLTKLGLPNRRAVMVQAEELGLA